METPLWSQGNLGSELSSVSVQLPTSLSLSDSESLSKSQMGVDALSPQ